MAARWFEKAARNGCAMSQYNLGLMYSKGEGVEQCYITAAQWYEKAAMNGLSFAQFYLGVT